MRAVFLLLLIVLSVKPSAAVRCRLELDLESHTPPPGYFVASCVVVRPPTTSTVKPYAIAHPLFAEKLQSWKVALVDSEFYEEGTKLVANVTLLKQAGVGQLEKRILRISDRIAVHLVQRPQFAGNLLEDLPVREMIKEVEADELVCSVTIEATLHQGKLRYAAYPARSTIRLHWCDPLRKSFIPVSESGWFELKMTGGERDVIIPHGVFYNAIKPLNFALNIGFQCEKTTQPKEDRLCALVQTFSSRVGLIQSDVPAWQAVFADHGPHKFLEPFRHFPPLAVPDKVYYPLMPGEKLWIAIALAEQRSPDHATIKRQLSELAQQGGKVQMPLANTIGAFLVVVEYLPPKNTRCTILPVQSATWLTEGRLELSGLGAKYFPGFSASIGVGHFLFGRDGLLFPG